VYYITKVLRRGRDIDEIRCKLSGQLAQLVRAGGDNVGSSLACRISPETLTVRHDELTSVNFCIDVSHTARN